MLTADLERVRLEKRATQMPSVMRPSDLRAYFSGLRRTAKRDVPAAKAAIVGALDGRAYPYTCSHYGSGHHHRTALAVRLWCRFVHCGGRI